MIYSYILQSEFVTYFIINIALWSSLCYLLENFTSFFAILYSVLCEFLCIKPKLNLKERYGEWAVVTGATNGIGKGYARELAARGLNIVLISRSETKLQEVSSEIESEFKVQTRWIVADFSEGEAVYERIAKQLEEIQIGILVNNVGTTYEALNPLDKVPERLIWNIIYVNIAAATFLTQLVIPQMKANKKGAIVNISSGCDSGSLPYVGVYSASKAYLHNLTRAITLEMKPYKDITVQLVSPLWIRTKIMNCVSTFAEVKYIVADVETFTKNSVSTLGRSDRTTGYWLHGVIFGFMKLFPRFIIETTSYRSMKHLMYKERSISKSNSIVPNAEFESRMDSFNEE